jgi:uncharacterized membrane protein YphA (DoxX/SURF4 family)
MPGNGKGIFMNDLDQGKTADSLAVACWVVRVALAASFLSAVADRLGIWGRPGADGVAWGSIPKYEEYVAQLNWYLPTGLVSAVGWVATTCEVSVAIGLLIGWRLSWVAVGAGLLLTTFAVTMAAALGPKSPLDYSVPSAAAAAFLLAAVSQPARSGKTGFDLPR